MNYRADTRADIQTLISIAWGNDLDDDTRDSMIQYFIYMDENKWFDIKNSIGFSERVKSVIDGIDLIRQLQ